MAGFVYRKCKGALSEIPERFVLIGSGFSGEKTGIRQRDMRLDIFLDMVESGCGYFNPTERATQPAQHF